MPPLTATPRATRNPHHASSNIRRKRNQPSILRENSRDRHHECPDLRFYRRVVRGFEDDLEGHRFHLRRSGQNTIVAVINDPISRRKAINRGIYIPWQDFPGFTQSRSEQVFSESVSADESV